MKKAVCRSNHYEESSEPPAEPAVFLRHASGASPFKRFHPSLVRKPGLSSGPTPERAEKNPAVKICVIDDNPDHMGDFKRILGATGYQVLAISRLIGASNQIREHQPDLLLINGNMSSISAEKIMSVLAKNLKALPFTIIYADFATESLELLALKVRADDYISPKGNYTPLVSRIRYYVRLLGKN